MLKTALIFKKKKMVKKNKQGKACLIHFLVTLGDFMYQFVVKNFFNYKKMAILIIIQ